MTKLCPMKKRIIPLGADPRTRESVVEDAFLPCLQEECAWYIEDHLFDSKLNMYVPSGGHCAILDISKIGAKP